MMVFEKQPDEGYAHSLSLSGCFGNGRTVEDAKRNRRDATTRPVAALLAHGEPVPQNERRAMSRNWPGCGCTARAPLPVAPGRLALSATVIADHRLRGEPRAAQLSLHVRVQGGPMVVASF